MVIVTTHFKQKSILWRHNLSPVLYLFNYMKKGNETFIVGIVRRNAKDMGAE